MSKRLEWPIGKINAYNYNLQDRRLKHLNPPENCQDAGVVCEHVS